jgi:hypothetical protein
MKSPFSKFSMIKLPKHKRFEFTPRVFDEEKESFEKRKKIIADELGVSQNDPSKKREINFRANMQDKGVSAYRSNATFFSNLRLLVILGILLIGFYFIFNNLDGMITALTK